MQSFVSQCKYYRCLYVCVWTIFIPKLEPMLDEHIPHKPYFFTLHRKATAAPQTLEKDVLLGPEPLPIYF